MLHTANQLTRVRCGFLAGEWRILRGRIEYLLKGVKSREDSASFEVRLIRISEAIRLAHILATFPTAC